MIRNNYWYFIVLNGDITQEMIDASTETNAFTLRQNANNTSSLLKFRPESVPKSLFDLGYSKKTKAEAVALLDTENLGG